MKRPRGTGSILRMNGGNVLWIKYHRNGKPIRESAHTTKVKEAEKLLRSRLAAISTGTYVGPKLESKTREGPSFRTSRRSRSGISHQWSEINR